MDIQKAAVNYSEEIVTCKDCGASFTSLVVQIFDLRQVMRSRCPECQTKRCHEETIRREAENKMLIANTRREWRTFCGIPPKYQVKDFSNFLHDKPGVAEAYQKSVEYAENFPIDYDSWVKKKGQAFPSLFLYSDDVWGNGKTHLVTSIAHRILDRWAGEDISCPVMFISEPEIYGRIQETYSYSKEDQQTKPSEHQIIGKLVTVRLLIIDDLGKQERNNMEFVRRTLFDIVNRRYNMMRPIIFTSNKHRGGLKDYLGPDQATLDRIIEMTEGNQIRVTGTSFRREKNG